MTFEIIGSITEIESIAVSSGIRNLQWLRDQFGPGRWRKLKGHATVRMSDESIRIAEVHWYEAEGIGRRRMKIKRFLD